MALLKTSAAESWKGLVGCGSPQPTMSQIHSMKVVAGAGFNQTHPIRIEV